MSVSSSSSFRSSRRVLVSVNLAGLPQADQRIEQFAHAILRRTHESSAGTGPPASAKAARSTLACSASDPGQGLLAAAFLPASLRFPRVALSPLHPLTHSPPHFSAPASVPFVSPSSCNPDLLLIRETKAACPVRPVLPGRSPESTRRRSLTREYAPKERGEAQQGKAQGLKIPAEQGRFTLSHSHTFILSHSRPRGTNPPSCRIIVALTGFSG